MSGLDAALHLAVATAAFLQGVTGIGFALIAGPVLLLALNDGAALQITALHALLIALVLAPPIRAFIDRQLLRRFALSALAALPFGVGLFAVASPEALQLLSGVVLGVLTLLMLSPRPAAAASRGPISERGGFRDYATGGLAGVLAGALSMPGPPVSLRMTALKLAKQQNRATVLAFFVLFYPIIFLGQTMVAGFSQSAAWTALVFAPATLIGAIAGARAAERVSEALFRRLVIAALLATAASLIYTASRALL